MTKLTPRNPSTDAMTNLRRRAICLDSSPSSGAVSILRRASAIPGFSGLGGGAEAPAGFSAVGFDIYDPSIPRRDHHYRYLQIRQYTTNVRGVAGGRGEVGRQFGP